MNECDKCGEDALECLCKKSSLWTRFIEWWNLKPTSIFRILDRPTCFVRSEMRNGETWLISYIRCDVCSKKAEECSFDYSDRQWKCETCTNLERHRPVP